LGVNVKFIDGELPVHYELKNQTIYTFVIDGSIHAIYSYGNGIIFNPNVTEVELDGYINRYSEKFEINFLGQERFFDFLGSVRSSNSSMFQNIDDDNSVAWCLMIGYLDFRGYTIDDLIKFLDEEGEFKSIAFNKLHYLSIFISYCCIIAGFTGKIKRERTITLDDFHEESKI
jgi:hypothetical protein